jgi:hypothetical protein
MNKKKYGGLIIGTHCVFFFSALMMVQKLMTKFLNQWNAMSIILIK